jgi:PKD repeat protein
MKKFTITLACAALVGSTFAQNSAPQDPEYCGSNKQRNRLFDMHPSFQVQDSIDQADFQEKYEDYMKGLNTSGGERASKIIPVVIHIVHLGGAENISDAQVYDAMRILNEDFTATNPDVSDVVPFFQPVLGNPDIEFRLATKDNAGNCHKGITRTYSSTTYDTGLDFSGHPIVDAVEAAHGNWPQNKYMNVFVCIDPDGSAGYTLTPSGFLPVTGMYGGILIRHTYFGSIGTGNYALARAFSHEVGHWLNLAHPWGPNNNPGNAGSCGDDDGVSDTPNTIGWTTCDTSSNGQSCGTRDNIQNFMEYSYCSRMFTAGQSARMNVALQSGQPADRHNLWQTSNLNATGVLNLNPGLCSADFEADTYVICEGQSIDFTDLSFHGPISWDWDFNGGIPNVSTDQHPTGIVYNTAGTYTVELTVGDGSTSLTETKTALIHVLPTNALPVPFNEGFESVTSLPNSDFFVENNDNDNTWEVTTAAAQAGSKSAYINNSLAMEGSKDDLISSTFDLSGLSGVTIGFDHAFAQRNSGTLDKLSVYVSNSCGSTWAVRKNLAGTLLSTAGFNNGNFVPSSGEWAHTDITNISPSYLTPSFRYRFEFTSDGGNNIYLDNINLTGPLGTPIITDESIALVLFPNPADDNVSIRFDVPSSQDVSVSLKDMLGRTVANIMNETTSGHQRLDWNTSALSAGVYHVSIMIGDQQVSKRIVIK